jgi:hypothetical protein
MKDFNQQQREWERLQENRPGGPGYDDNPDRDDDWEEERKERMLDIQIERAERRRERGFDF